MLYKYTFLAIFAALTCFPLLAQPISKHRVVYDARHTLPRSEKLQGLNVLHFSGEASLFVHKDFPKENVSELGHRTARLDSGDPDGRPIFVSLTTGKIFTKTNGANGPFSWCLLEEDNDLPNWTISTEQRLIGGYPTLYATTTYEGRDYEAWFAPGIPAPFGPYRLRGLPGLILEAQTLDGQVNWTFVGYEPTTSEPTELVYPQNVPIYTYDEYVQAKLAYKARKESKSTSENTVTIRGGTDYSIEQNKFNVYQKYPNGKQ